MEWIIAVIAVMEAYLFLRWRQYFLFICAFAHNETC